MTKKKHDLQDPNFERRARRAYTLFASLGAVLTLTVMPALATSGDDPLTVVNNLSEFSASVSGR